MKQLKIRKLITGIPLKVKIDLTAYEAQKEVPKK